MFSAQTKVQGRGIYPAGTPALQIRVGELQGPFATATFLRTEVRAPFARAATTLNRYIPMGFLLEAQGCRDEATLGHRSRSPANRNAVAACLMRRDVPIFAKTPLRFSING